MELRNKLLNSILLQINREDTKIRLKFLDDSTDQIFNLSFDGLLFETSYLMLNKRVIRAELTSILGFKAATQLNYLGENPSGYKQLFIQLEANDSEFKNELICAFKDFKIRTSGAIKVV